MGDLKIIYVKMTKEWGGFHVGDVIRFGENKGRSRIALGLGVEVPKQRAVNDPEPERLKVEKPKVETATMPIVAETAEVTPQKTEKPKHRFKKQKSDE